MLRMGISPFGRDHGALPHFVRAIPWLLYDSHSDPSGIRTRHFRLERPVNWPFIRWDLVELTLDDALFVKLLFVQALRAKAQ